MEVVAAPPTGGGVPPFHDHDVREWSRLDSLTGVLERARLETDNWTANTNNAKHKYNKVVDSRARTDADGALQAQARRQLEVFQSQVPGGHLQVIKTHTVTSSRWSNKGTTAVVNGNADTDKDFENLQLALNPLDLSSEKSKASVGRSASRRPPTRQRLKPDTSPQSNLLRNAHITAAVNLHRVSRLCHQIHETAVRQAFGSRSPKPSIDERQSGDGSVEIYEIESDTKSLNGHTNLSRTKSTSSEDVLLLTPEKDNATKSIEDLEDLEQLRNWRRTSKIRRSLQFPKQNKPQVTKPVDLPENSVSVKKIREDLEKGRRLNTALRGNNIDLEALDQILQSISSSSSVISDKTEDEEVKLITSKKRGKRDSFVTVESLREVRGRLRRTSSPSSDIYSNKDKDEDIDDGIDTEEKQSEMNEKPAPSRVRSYVFGMEAMLNNKKPILGTGSLESRTKLVNGNSNNRNEDWYNRRKSYGFEKVHSHEESTNSISNKNKNFVESSTDSGICRSTEIVVVPTVPKKNYSEDSNNCSSENNSDIESKSFIPFEPGIQNNTNYGNVKKMTNLFNTSNNWSKRQTYNDWQPKSTTITIPIINEPDKEIKRHSIAVDDTKYAGRRSLAINDQSLDDDNGGINRKTKKVEFCKTEVHFAADSGKVNIVETDEKPPPTNNFRRRRRNSGPLVPMNEDYHRNGLPVLHFGDSSYEKHMFGVSDDDDKPGENIYENVPPRVPSAFGVVTVNTNNNIDYPTEKKEHQENENIRGILKNKPIKPKPYHLGETIPFLSNSDEESKKWGVRLRPVNKEEPPVWKSTVSVHNSLYDKTDTPEFKKLLRNLRPTRRDSDSDNNYSDGYSSVRVRDNRRSSWSVTDKQAEELQNGESKGYSTKVNFGDGEATVIESDNYAENNRHPTWPRADSSKDSRQLLNKGLVVRIGRADSASNHMVCSKMTTTQDRNNTTTTTKITIDLSPSPPVSKQDKAPTFSYAKYQRSQNHSFKSTSLILNTIKDHETDKIPQQLEALKKLYDDVHSDSDADKEVQQLMSQINEKDLVKIENDNSSVVSGSWSKISAYKQIANFMTSKNSTAESKFDLNDNHKIEKDSTVNGLKPAQNTNKSPEHPPTKYNVNLSRHKFSPIVIRKAAPTIRPELKSALPAEKLSSPSLVGKNVNGYEHTEQNKSKTPTKLMVNGRQSPVKNGRKSPTKSSSPTKELKTISDSKYHTRHDMVLRQPKKSEMTYFGVKVSPEQPKKLPETKLTEKPDLLQHYKPNPTPMPKPRRKSPENKKSSPIYENINPARNAKQMDSTILDELTKAADQIMQVVNGYTDDDLHNRLSSGDEAVTETKPLKPSPQNQKSKPTTRTNSRHNSTTPVKTTPDKQKKKVSESTPTSKSITKARRLQRASSREALLQSHGSSSEDLSAPVETPVRKPRLIKKTKATQLTITNGLEIAKKSPKKTDDKIINGLPEIRHKTAVSTIRSTQEKNTRDRSKHRTEDVKKRSPIKREVSKGANINSSRSRTSASPSTHKDAVTTHRTSTAHIKRCHRSEASTRH